MFVKLERMEKCFLSSEFLSKNIYFSCNFRAIAKIISNKECEISFIEMDSESETIWFDCWWWLIFSCRRLLWSVLQGQGRASLGGNIQSIQWQSSLGLVHQELANIVNLTQISKYFNSWFLKTILYRGEIKWKFLYFLKGEKDKMENLPKSDNICKS